MVFLDEAEVFIKSGRGGSGAVSFHREKFVPFGGPNGSDGGRGGDVVLIADRGKRTLYDFKLNPTIEAANGEHASGNKKGRDGKGVEVKVPVGTVVYDAELGDALVDLNRHGMKVILLKGGKGGFGNQHYANSIRQAPNFAQKGAPGEELVAKFELKLLADVGLVGLPNAGKSTLISAISAARPKIADYPFTTIVPNLGVVSVEDHSFVVADMPGLIEGASQGVGLGHQFLKHVERNRVLVHVVDSMPIDGSDPIANYELIERELQIYSDEIFARPRIIALNKIDLIPAGEFGALRQRFEQLGRSLFPISAATGDGLKPLLYELVSLLQQHQPDDEETLMVPQMHSAVDRSWEVKQCENGFEITGKRLIRLIEMTNLDNEEALRYLQRRLKRIGVFDRLREMGIEEGDDVRIGEFAFSYTDEQ
jgi:GTP-binding protein